MAMSHALLLFSSLFFLPVLLGEFVKFRNCDIFETYAAHITRVGVSEPSVDGTVDIVAYGYARNKIGGRVYVNVTFWERVHTIINKGLCEVTNKCNTKGEIEARTFFTLLLRRVRFLHDEVKDTKYTIYVGDKDQEPPAMCVVFFLGHLPGTLVSA